MLAKLVHKTDPRGQVMGLMGPACSRMDAGAHLFPSAMQHSSLLAPYLKGFQFSSPILKYFDTSPI